MFRRRSDVLISDMYPIKIHIWKCPRSNAEKLDLVQIFVLTHVQQIPICVRCEQKNLIFFCASVNAAIVTKLLIVNRMSKVDRMCSVIMPFSIITKKCTQTSILNNTGLKSLPLAVIAPWYT